MYKNYFKLAFRNLTRNKSNSIINVVGLSIGIACCLLILLWVADELSYDKWNKKADRTYRVASEINFGGKHQSYAVSPAPLAQALIDDFPEVEAAVKFRDYGSVLVKRTSQNYKEREVLYADSTLFDVFDLELLKGDKLALTEPNSLVISASMASKYFNNEEPLGQTLTIDDQTVLEVTGVIKDLPHNTHFKADFLISLTGMEEANNGIWLSNNFPTYYVLKEGVDHAAFESKVSSHIMSKYTAPQIETMMGVSYDEMIKSGAYIKYFYQPLKDIHLHSDLVAELEANGSIQHVWIFLSAAFFILIIACVNFMNLTTARSALRAKEIGMRKVLGSLKRNLVSQFLCESLVLTSVAFVISMIIAQVTLPAYNALANKELVIPYGDPSFWGVSLAGILVVGLLAGSYPAFFLSGFKPIDTLSGRLSSKYGNVNLRNGLVIFQFLIAATLIIGTLGIQKQMNFIQNKKMGFDREQVLVLNDAYALGNNKKAYKQELVSHPDIKSASFSSFLPTPSSRSNSPLCKSAEIREDNCVSIQIWDIDEDYFETMGMNLIEGRAFDAEMATDSQAVIINQTAAKLLGLDNPLDHSLYGSSNTGADFVKSMKPLKIIGVVEDFHFESLRENIGALSLMFSPSSGSLAIKLASGNPEDAIAHAESAWQKMAPGQPFSYTFMDESFDRIYQTELRVGKIFTLFSGLGIFIACLGLFGLASFATERRRREIGIRKVLGATTTSIIGLLSKDFMVLVLLALVIAVPLAWYLMREWLANFAYRTDMDVWVFIVASVAAILVAFLTVGFHSFRSATANPVESLRSE
jgi:putative ABC transport system permease protein